MSGTFGFDKICGLQKPQNCHQVDLESAKMPNYPDFSSFTITIAVNVALLPEKGHDFELYRFPMIFRGNTRNYSKFAQYFLAMGLKVKALSFVILWASFNNERLLVCRFRGNPCVFSAIIIMVPDLFLRSKMWDLCA